MSVRAHRQSMPPQSGGAELRAAFAASRGLWFAIFAFSFVVNVLMLTGPLYMLQIYDRVLSSGSEPTLVALSLLALWLFAAMGLLDGVRMRLLSRCGLRLQDALERRVFAAMLSQMRRASVLPAGQSAQRALEGLRRFIAAPVMTALFDLPWIPLFLIAIFLLHPLLGWLALAGGALLVAVALCNRWAARRPLAQDLVASSRAEQIALSLKSEAATLHALGMEAAGFLRWRTAAREALHAAGQAADVAANYGAASKMLRLVLQSAVLGLGAWLALRGELNPSAMIAASVLFGRALAPVEMLVSQWDTVVRAREGLRVITALLSAEPAHVPRLLLPRPEAHLSLEALSVADPTGARLLLDEITFTLGAGQALGVVGASGAGKSSLARALTGLLAPATGSIRLNGASLDQYAPDQLGRWIGYLPQHLRFFNGTIAENIARLSPDPDPRDVVEAAQKARAHEMILRLPLGYETLLDQSGGSLSGGQLQRIALARALYQEPVLLVLDEPNAHLDHEGSVALNEAVRRAKAEGSAVLIMAHRPAAIQECDFLMVLDEGHMRALGPREQVLRGMVHNHSDIVRAQEAAHG